MSPRVIFTPLLRSSGTQNVKRLNFSHHSGCDRQIQQAELMAVIVE